MSEQPLKTPKAGYRDVNSALNPKYIAMCNSLLLKTTPKLEQTVCAETKCMQEAWTNTCAISAGFVLCGYKSCFFTF